MDVKLVNKVLAQLKKLVDTTTSEYRKALDANIHMMDFSYRALKNSSQDLTVDEYNAIVDAVKPNYKNLTSLKDAVGIIRDRSTKVGYTAFVEDPKFGTYILASSYDSLQKNLAPILKNLSHHATDFTGVDETGKTVTNVGHISARELSNTRSPLEVKLAKVLKAMPLGASSVVMEQLDKLYNTHTLTTSYDFQRPDFDIKKFSGILGSTIVLVTLQTSGFNNALATKFEAAIEAKVRQYVQSSEFVELLVNLPGSNSIKEDIEEGLLSNITGKPAKGNKHSKKSPKVLKTSVKGKTTVSPFTPIRDIGTGKFTSLANLEAIIRVHLQDVVSANMGNGADRHILNYRTGRLAESAKLDRLARTRDGAISAYYTYMKNPYATFSVGGKQQFPRSRDPKLLISKSIKEIAATVVSNRLRAILV